MPNYARLTKSELIKQIKALKAELRKCRRDMVRLQEEYSYQTATRFVASSCRRTFHRPNCQWASYFEDSPSMIEFSSHQEAVEAGYVPCKTCRA